MAMNNQIERVCISPNSECNLKCRYCYFFQQYQRIPKKRKLTSYEILKILSRIHDYYHQLKSGKEIKVNFVGSGEPLLSWREIQSAISEFRKVNNMTGIKLYMVTNGILLTNLILHEMKALDIVPSISLDGPQEIHDKNRVSKNNEGTFHAVMKAIDLMRNNHMDIIINTTVTNELISNFDAYFEFIQDQNITKVIFDRLVDIPEGVNEVTTNAFYSFLSNLRGKDLEEREVGNLDAYRRALLGQPDRVCTMYGSCCGAGLNNIIYLQSDVYPCGRMFGDPSWRLGGLDDNLTEFQHRIMEKIPMT